jgi:hypothetical protein
VEERPAIIALAELMGFSENSFQDGKEVLKKSIIYKAQKENQAISLKKVDAVIQIITKEMMSSMRMIRKGAVTEISKVLSSEEARYIVDIILYQQNKKTLTQLEIKKLEDFYSSSRGRKIIPLYDKIISDAKTEGIKESAPQS